MPKQETHLPQRAVVWEASSRFDEDGNPVIGSNPYQVCVKWERSKREALSPTEAPLAIQTIALVDREIPIGSQMWLGKLTALPSPLVDLYEVVDNETIGDVKGRNFQYTVTLRKKAD